MFSNLQWELSMEPYLPWYHTLLVIAVVCNTFISVIPWEKQFWVENLRQLLAADRISTNQHPCYTHCRPSMRMTSCGEIPSPDRDSRLNCSRVTQTPFITTNKSMEDDDEQWSRCSKPSLLVISFAYDRISDVKRWMNYGASCEERACEIDFVDIFPLLYRSTTQLTPTGNKRNINHCDLTTNSVGSYSIIMVRFRQI